MHLIWSNDNMVYVDVRAQVASGSRTGSGALVKKELGSLLLERYHLRLGELPVSQNKFVPHSYFEMVIISRRVGGN